MQFSFLTYVGVGCLPGLSTFESAREEMLHYTGFTVDVVHCCELELVTTAVEAALQTVAHLAAEAKLQDALLKAGVIWSVSFAWSFEYCALFKLIFLVVLPNVPYIHLFANGAYAIRFIIRM